MILRPDPHAPWYVWEAVRAYNTAAPGQKRRRYRDYQMAVARQVREEQEGYDPATNAKASYDLAIKALRLECLESAPGRERYPGERDELRREVFGHAG